MKIILIAVLAGLSVVLVVGIIFFSFFQPFSKTNSSRVISAIAQIRVALAEHYDIKGTFNGFSLNKKDLLPLTKQIKKYSYNKTPLKIITYSSTTSPSSFCMFVPVYKTIDGIEWYCADSVGRAEIVRTNPAGVCTDGQPARCPDDETPPSRSIIQTSTTNTNPSQTQIDEIERWKIYKNEQYGFEFKYPEKLVLRTNSPSFIEFIRKIPIKNCIEFPASCSDYTFNPMVRFNFFEGDYLSEKEKYYNPDNLAEDIIVDNIKGFSYKEEYILLKEKEGLINYMVPFQQFKNKDFILSVNLYYIDENFAVNYRGAKDFIPLEQQKQLINEILSTFKFSKKDQDTEIEEGYIKAVYTKDNKEYLDIDYIQFLGGDEAVKVAKEDGMCEVGLQVYDQCLPEPFYIKNQSLEIRTFEISQDVQISKVYMVDADAVDYSSDGLKPISYEEFKSFWGNNSGDNHWRKAVPYMIEIKNNVITKIRQEHIP